MMSRGIPLYLPDSGLPWTLPGLTLLLAALFSAGLTAIRPAQTDEGAQAMQWKTHKPIELQGLTVEVSEPVLVKRSRWYCWFPRLLRQPDGTLWAWMQAYPDIHVSSSFGYLSRSKDGGLTWDEVRVVGDSGCSGHLILPDNSALLLPYYLRRLDEDALGSPCNVIRPDGRIDYVASGVRVTGWPRRDRPFAPETGTAGFVFNGQTVRDRDGKYLATLYGTFEGQKRLSVVLAESGDGFHWTIRSIVADADCPLAGSEGPCEPALCRLPDGRLMCIFRLDSFAPYGQTFSQDEGRTWSTPRNITPLSVEPSVAVLGNNVVALSGGRPGVYVWFSRDAERREWQSVDIAALHNAACRPEDRIHELDARRTWAPGDAEEMRRAGVTGYTSSYTQLAVVDDHTLLLIYDRLGFGWWPIPDGFDETKSVWVVRLRIL